ncbi:MAG: hypothetical protein AB1673_13670 [Actinomycetota bacterium]|jgi:hypothetical protein
MEDPIGSASADGLDDPLCEVCARPVAAGTAPKRVGACEFPFHVHDDCLEQLGPLAAEITEMCKLAEDQPDGLLWLGSWDPLDKSESSTG